MPPPPPAHLGALTSRRIIKYKYTRYYLEWLQMACLERCIKWSWNLIFGAEKENFSPLILSLEVWIQRWVIPQHNEVTGLWKIKIYLCKNRSGSDNMKQNLEIIFNLHFWLSMKTSETAGGVWDTTATGWEPLSSPSEDPNPLPGQSTWQVQPIYVLIVRHPRCVPGCWDLRATSSNTLVQQGLRLWVEDKLITC